VKRLQGACPRSAASRRSPGGHGHLHQEQLWDVLQATPRGCSRVPSRSRGVSSPSSSRPRAPQGGAAGLRRHARSRAHRRDHAAGRHAHRGDRAARRPEVRLASGERGRLVDECGSKTRRCAGSQRRRGVGARDHRRTWRGGRAPLYALVPSASSRRSPRHARRPLRCGLPRRPAPSRGHRSLARCRLDDGAIRARIGARRRWSRTGLLRDPRVPRAATGYEIRRAYVELRRALDPRASCAPPCPISSTTRAGAPGARRSLRRAQGRYRRERYRRAISHEPPQ